MMTVLLYHYFFFLNDPPPPETSTLPLHDALPIYGSYDFYTRATDKAGNLEAAPAGPDSSTLVDTRDPTSSASSPAYSTSTSFTLGYTASDPLKGTAEPTPDLQSLSAKAPRARLYK